jgi:AmmeMemoRadiSam system protein B
MKALRAPAVAGRFYPGHPAALNQAVRDFVRFQNESAPQAAIAVMVPHAGFVYSGGIAGETFSCVRVPETAIVLCPNHTGMGSMCSVWHRGSWEIPGAEIPIDEALADDVIREAGLEPDQRAHLREHAIEVELPFLVNRRPDVAVVPICLGRLSSEECREVGEGIARALAGRRDTLLVASTDMSHYISADRARALDALALDRVLHLDAVGLHRTVEDLRITMCGYVPTTVVLFAALALGARVAELVRYGHSGETSGDFDRVVGYAGVVVR